MNTSSFLGGILIGAAATTILSKNKGSIMSSAMGNNAKHKMMDLASFGMNSANSRESEGPTGGSSYQSNHSSGTHSQTHSKESSMNQIQDFIRTNPDVKREVDMILKETNSVIPGL